LAYEKGAYVLAAAQSNQAALELQRFGHGVLTYTLVTKGLSDFHSDADGDNSITVGEWFRYARNQVPIEIATLAKERSASGRPIFVGNQPITVQRPQFFIRRNQGDDWAIAARDR
jgi:hypothetical protein